MSEVRDTRHHARTAIVLAWLACLGGLLALAPRLFPDSPGWLLLALVAGFAAVEVVALPMPRGGRFRVVAGVGIASIMLLAPLAVVAVYVTGALFGVLMEDDSSRFAAHARGVARRGATLWLASLWYGVLSSSTPFQPDKFETYWPAILVALGFMAADLVGWSVQNDRHSGSSALRTTRVLTSLLGAAYLGQVSVGIVLALVLPSLGVLAVLVLVVLMLIMQHTSGLLLRVRSAYTRTVSALARTAEMSTRNQVGHGERVAATCAILGRRMGLSGQTIERLTLAALVHDIGQIGVASDSSVNPVQLAAKGAELIAQVSFLASLAPVVRRHHLAYHEYLDTADSDGLLSRIVHVACALDWSSAVGSSENRVEPGMSALEQFSAKAGSEYDPLVVEHLMQAVAAGEIRA